DLAILKAVGFVGRQVRASVAWQATAIAGAGLIVGLPLRVGAGGAARARRAGAPGGPGGPGGGSGKDDLDVEAAGWPGRGAEPGPVRPGDGLDDGQAQTVPARLADPLPPQLLARLQKAGRPT